MSLGGDEQPIIIIKKVVKKGGGHHGGGWKVAYADFVTAMMAFFLVMWIVGMDSDVKDIVQGYFNNPIGFRQSFGSGMDPTSQGSNPIPSDLQRIPRFVRQVEERRFRAVRDQIENEIDNLTGDIELGGQIEIVVTPEGLRIELREGMDGASFFSTGSDNVTPQAERVIRIVAEGISELPNHVIIEGHTDAAPYPGAGYTNWELSADRANAARRLLTEYGMQPYRVMGVRGYADRNLLFPIAPLDPANRRVTILIPYLEEAQSIEGGNPLGGPGRP